MASAADAFTRVRAAALAYPEAYEESPWGELAIKVRKKVFVFLGRGDGTRLSLSVKLPDSAPRALELPQASPTGYGLGKSGWVSIAFPPGSEVPLAQVLDWLDESYRAVAPKRLVKTLEERPEPGEASTSQVLGNTRILLVGNDPLRLERARAALEAHGADPIAVDLAGALDAAGAGAPDIVVVDLSRNASEATALLPELGLVVEAPILVAGVRDAPTERALAGNPGLAWTSREPPGDPIFVEGLIQRVGR